MSHHHHRDFAARRADAASHFSALISVGGTIYQTAELRPEVVGAVLDAAAEHGIDSVRWPTEVRADIERRLASGKRRTYRDAAEHRRQELLDEQGAVIAKILADHDDPSKWSAETLDHVARAEARLAAFDQLVAAARRRNFSWDESITTHKEH